MPRLGFTQERASVNNCEVRKRSFQKKQGSQRGPQTLVS